VRRSVSRSTRLWAGALAALVGLTLAAPPFAGADTKPVAPIMATTIQAAASARLAALDTSAAVRPSQAGGAATSGEPKQPFIKSTKGIIAVLLLAGGITWALVSRSQDAVHSPGRK
jgi:hypothetical protein